MTFGKPGHLDTVAKELARVEAIKAGVGSTLPFYRRTLDSFADDIITRARPSREGCGWYAWLDVGPKSWPSDPDFCRYAATEAEARALCAKAIREDAVGIGKFAPHGILMPGWDLEFRLMRHWAGKEVLSFTRGHQPGLPNDAALAQPITGSEDREGGR